MSKRSNKYMLMGKVAYIISAAMMIAALVTNLFPPQAVSADPVKDWCHLDQGNNTIYEHVPSSGGHTGGGTGHIGDVAATLINGIYYCPDDTIPTPPPPVLGCMDPTATNYNSLATQDNGSCTYPPVLGCMDPTATNYNSLATQDNGSCTYAPVLGCTDPTATNYNSLATQNDGSCTYTTPVLGCTDPTATNYNSLATQNDGSCTYTTPVLGCTDPTATNYNSLATQNDGTCTYPPLVCTLPQVLNTAGDACVTPPPPSQITICYKGVTLIINESDLDKYPGCTLGACTPLLATGAGPAILIPVTGVDMGMLGRVLPGTLFGLSFSFAGLGLLLCGFARRRDEDSQN